MTMNFNIQRGVKIRREKYLKGATQIYHGKRTALRVDRAGEDRFNLIICIFFKEEVTDT